MGDAEESRLEQILSSYLEAREAGEQPDLEQLCAGSLELLPRLRELVQREEQLESALHVRWNKREEAASATTDDPVAGQKLGAYTLLEPIGSGGVGQVFLAREDPLGRMVALKVIRPGRAVDRATRLRFRREVEITAALDHPNIVPLYATGEDQGFLWSAMRLLGGPSLETLEEPSEPRWVARVGADLARALDAAHRIGVVHRDVKPGNVVLSEGVPHLVDFGLARAIDHVTLTGRGTAPGTLPYMAPEQLEQESDALDARTDVYGLAATLYQAATGRPPFEAETPEALMRQILTREPPPLGLPTRDRDLEVILLRALSKEPGRRFSSTREMAEDLDRYLRGEPIHSKPTSVTHRLIRLARRNKIAAALLVITLLAGLCIAGLLLDKAVSRRTKREVSLRRAATLIDTGAFSEARALLVGELADAPETAALTSRLEACEIRQLLLDQLLSTMEAQDPQNLQRLAARLEQGPHEVRDSQKAHLALCTLAIIAGDPAEARSHLAELRDYPRAAAALGALANGTDPAQAVGNPVPLKPGDRSPEVAGDDHVFTAVALRLFDAPRGAQESELEVALRVTSFDCYRARYLLGMLYRDQGNREDAGAQFASLTGHELHRPAVLTAMARMDAFARRFESAERLIQEARELLRASPLGEDWLPLQIVALELLMMREDPKGLLAGIAAAEQVSPGHPWLDALRAHAARLGKDMEGAMRYIERGLAGSPRPAIRRLLELSRLEHGYLAIMSRKRSARGASGRAEATKALEDLARAARLLGEEAYDKGHHPIAATAHLVASRSQGALGHAAASWSSLRSALDADDRHPAANRRFVIIIANRVDAEARGEKTPESEAVLGSARMRLPEARSRARRLIEGGGRGVIMPSPKQLEKACWAAATLAFYDKDFEACRRAARQGLASWESRGRPTVDYLGSLEWLATVK